MDQHRAAQFDIVVRKCICHQTQCAHLDLQLDWGFVGDVMGTVLSVPIFHCDTDTAVFQGE